jgi:hypothetical protein
MTAAEVAVVLVVVVVVVVLGLFAVGLSGQIYQEVLELAVEPCPLA